MRTDRRPGLPIVPAWRFWPVYGAATLVTISRIALMAARFVRLRRRRKRDPLAVFYRDLALTPMAEDVPLQLFTATQAATAAAAKRKRFVTAAA